MKCLILGGGGFIGSNLTDALLSNGHSVRIFEKLEKPIAADKRAEWVQGDFQDPGQVKTALEGIDIIFHLISTTLPAESNAHPATDISTNLVPTLKMLELASMTAINKVVFISSGGTVYGDPLSIPIREDHPTEPTCSYGIQKLAIEKYLSVFNRLYGLQYSITRISNPYGNGQNPEGAQGAATIFLYRNLCDQKIEIWGDGDNIRDYLYISDVTSALLKLMDYRGSERIFNIGSGRGYSLNEMLGIVGEVTDKAPDVIYKPARDFDIRNNVLDISLAKRELGWEPRVSMREGLELLRDHFMANYI